MKPPAFVYFAPEAVEEALALLDEHAASVSILAGGQSLVPLMNMRAVRPEALIDINRLADLDYIRQDGAGLSIGALTRQQRLADSHLVASVAPLLKEAAETTGFAAIRSRGTLGGTLAYADPGAQLSVALLALGGRVTIASRAGGERSVPVADLFTSAYATTIAPDELLVAVQVPAFAPTAGFAMQEYRRGYGGPPLLAVAAVLALDEQGMIRLARLALGGADDVPVRLVDGEARLMGSGPTAEVFHEAAELAAARVRRGDPVFADVALRRRIVRALVTRALETSHRRADAGRPGKEVE